MLSCYYSGVCEGDVVHDHHGDGERHHISGVLLQWSPGEKELKSAG